MSNQTKLSQDLIELSDKELKLKTSLIRSLFSSNRDTVTDNIKALSVLDETVKNYILFFALCCVVKENETASIEELVEAGADLDRVLFADGNHEYGRPIDIAENSESWDAADLLREIYEKKEKDQDAKVFKEHGDQLDKAAEKFIIGT